MGASLAEETFLELERCTLEMEKLGFSVEDAPTWLIKASLLSRFPTVLKFMVTRGTVKWSECLARVKSPHSFPTPVKLEA